MSPKYLRFDPHFFLVQVVSLLIIVGALSFVTGDNSYNCGSCMGTGCGLQCSQCEGSGAVTKDCISCSGNGHTYGGFKCYICDGRGFKIERCSFCRGSGCGMKCGQCQGRGYIIERDNYGIQR